MRIKSYDEMTTDELESTEYGRRVPSDAVTGYLMLALLAIAVVCLGLAVCLL